MSLFRELRRRRVFRLAGLYLIGAWLILQIADVLLEPLGLPAWSMSALIWIVVAGFFVAIALSWRYDIGDDGLVRVTTDSDHASGAAPLAPSDYAILAGGVLAAGLFAWLAIDHLVDRSAPPARPVANGNAVAVLPFINRTGDESLNYLGEGVAEEVTNHLSKVDELSVLAYTVSFGYAGPSNDPRQIGQDLDVDFVVMGSIRSAGTSLRVSAQLIETDTGVQLWSVDSGAVDQLSAFEVQDSISLGIADAMAGELGLEGVNLPSLAGRAPDPVAYDLYLKGRSIWFRRGAEDIGKAVDYLAEAVRLDPDFAAAWAALASAYLTWPGYSPAGYGTWSEAMPAAEKALAIDPDLAEPHAVLAAFARHDRDWIEAGAQLEQALALDNNSATVHYWYSEHLAMTGRYGESVEHLARTIALDPTYVAPRIDVVFALLMYGRTDVAMREFESVWSLGVRAPAAVQAGIITNVMAGNYSAAEELILGVPLPDAHKETLVQFLRVESGDLDLQSVLERLEQSPEARPDYRLLVWFAARTGALDLAMQVFSERAEDSGAIETRVLWGPGHRLPEHPDFVRLLEELGLVDYWEQSRIGDLCGLDGGSLSCKAAPANLPTAPLNALLGSSAK